MEQTLRDFLTVSEGTRWPPQRTNVSPATRSSSGCGTRHRFTPGAIALGIVAFFGGMMFLAPYLLWASAEAGGDPELMLLGRRRARP